MSENKNPLSGTDDDFNLLNRIINSVQPYKISNLTDTSEYSFRHYYIKKYGLPSDDILTKNQKYIRNNYETNIRKFGNTKISYKSREFFIRDIYDFIKNDFFLLSRTDRETYFADTGNQGFYNFVFREGERKTILEILEGISSIIHISPYEIQNSFKRYMYRRKSFISAIKIYTENIKNNLSTQKDYFLYLCLIYRLYFNYKLFDPTAFI